MISELVDEGRLQTESAASREEPRRSRIVSQLKEESYQMNFYEPCLFSKFAVREEPAVDGGSIAPGEFVGCVLLEVDDHLMGDPEKARYESMERLRQRIKFGKWHRLIQDGPSFFGGRHFTVA